MQKSLILSHRIEGDLNGIAVMMIHPLGGDQTFWDECRRHFGSSVLSISCDLGGSGTSPDLDEPLTLEKIVADVEQLRRHLNLDKIIIMGCAVGAMAAALYAAEHNDKTVALVMSNPGIRVTSEGGANLRQRAKLVRENGMAALLPQAIENAFVGYEATELRRLYEYNFLQQKPENYAFAAIGAASADISKSLVEITCPVLLTPGRNDRLFGMQHTNEISAIIRHADVVEFAHGAHFIPYQQSQDFGRTFANFLDGNSLRPKPSL